MITNKKAKRTHMHTLPNYLEYHELFDEFTDSELKEAHDALFDSELQEELYEKESILLTFLIDTKKQEQLILYFKDLSIDEDILDDITDED